MRIERYNGNEIFEISNYDFDGIIPENNFRSLKQISSPFDWCGYPQNPQGIEFY